MDRINPSSGPNAVPWNENARFGTASFNADKGASINTPINGSATRNSFGQKIDGLQAKDSSPLAEALVDIAQYLSGNTLIGVDADLTQANISSSNPMDDAACANNFAILLTDGGSQDDEFTHTPFNGNFETAIGNYDGDAVENTTPHSRPDAPPYTNGGTDWLDDVSQYLFETDLRPLGLKNNRTLAGTQNIVTYVIGFNTDHPLLKEAAEQGDGVFYEADSAQGLVDSLNAAIDDIILRSATFSAASIPSTRTSFDDAIFTAYFEPSGEQSLWLGHLQAYQIGPDFTILGKDGNPAVDPTNGEFFEPRDSYFWDAAVCLSDSSESCYVSSRKLYHNEGSPLVRTPFNPAQISATDLGIASGELSLFPDDPATSASYATADALADAVVGYVSGTDVFDDDSDSNWTERRELVLGDIFHSNPVAVGGVTLYLINEPGYGPIGNPAAPISFFDQFYARQRVLYAGANDGMLHAFDAGDFLDPDSKVLTSDEHYGFGTGSELFGYIPNAALPNLKKLVKTGEPKPFFVDGSPSVADVWLPSTAGDVTKDTNEWTSALVTGMRNGGKSYLALDITDPTAVAGDVHGAYPKLMWEFNSASEFQGYTWSQPVLTRVKIKAGVAGDHCGEDDGDGNGDCRETWVAIFGGGYLDQSDPSTPQYLTADSDSGWDPDSRSVYIVELSSGNVLARAKYDALDTGGLEHMYWGFPSTPAVADLDSDGFADVVYIGDVGGQLWKWDISAVGQPDLTTGRVDSTQWPIGRIFVAPQGSNGHYRELFFPPSLSYVNGELTIAFGTGERTNLSYDNTVGTDDNHFYVFRDPHPTGADAFTSAPYGIGDLTEIGPLDNSDPDPDDRGFYLVAADDEKFVTESVAFSGFVISLAYDPDLNTTVGACEQGGSSVLYVFSLADGTGYFAQDVNGVSQRSVRIGSGLPTSPRISHLGSQVNVVVQTSTGRLLTPQGPPKSATPLDLLYWRTM